MESGKWRGEGSGEQGTGGVVRKRGVFLWARCPRTPGVKKPAGSVGPVRWPLWRPGALQHHVDRLLAVDAFEPQVHGVHP
jgi:hypothetical protein